VVVRGGSAWVGHWQAAFEQHRGPAMARPWLRQAGAEGGSGSWGGTCCVLHGCSAVTHVQAVQQLRCSVP
jgi:hypothetical protein